MLLINIKQNHISWGPSFWWRKIFNNRWIYTINVKFRIIQYLTFRNIIIQLYIWKAKRKGSVPFAHCDWPQPLTATGA